ncbi:hypothetical protein Tco_0337408, partial [Tanacetum coccineum]
MDAPTIPVSIDSSEGNFEDAIDIGLDVDHLVPVAADAFPAVTIVTILASLGEAMRGIHEYLQGVPIEEEMSTLRFKMGMAKAENASLRGKIRTMEAIKTVTCSQERRTRREMEQRLASVHESQLLPNKLVLLALKLFVLGYAAASWIENLWLLGIIFGSNDNFLQIVKNAISLAVLYGMDIAKITRKRSKPDKHGRGNGRAHKEPGECYQ